MRPGPNRQPPFGLAVLLWGGGLTVGALWAVQNWPMSLPAVGTAALLAGTMALLVQMHGTVVRP